MSINTRISEDRRIQLQEQNETIDTRTYCKLVGLHKSEQKFEIEVHFPSQQDVALNVFGFKTIYLGFIRDRMTQLRNLIAGKNQATDTIAQLTKKLKNYEIGYNIPTEYWHSNAIGKKAPTKEQVGDELAKMSTDEILALLKAKGIKI